MYPCNSVIRIYYYKLKISSKVWILYVKRLTFCIHTLVAERKRADKKGNHNTQFNTETSEKVGNKKTKSSKTSINLETLTKHFNGIKNTKLDEEYKVCWMYHFNVSNFVIWLRISI